MAWFHSYQECRHFNRTSCFAHNYAFSISRDHGVQGISQQALDAEDQDTKLDRQVCGGHGAISYAISE